jgi:hypothetical protein
MAPSLAVIQTSNNDHIAVAEIAAASAATDLGYFHRLSALQASDFFWIGLL